MGERNATRILASWQPKKKKNNKRRKGRGDVEAGRASRIQDTHQLQKPPKTIKHHRCRHGILADM